MNRRIALDLNCPSCHTTLMDTMVRIDDMPAVHCLIQVPGPNPKLPRQVPIWFSSIYGSFAFQCEHTLAANERMVLICPACQSHLDGERLCSSCGDPMVSLEMTTGGRLTVCTHRGCKQHLIELGDDVPALERLFNVPDRPAGENVPSPLHPRRIRAGYTPDSHQSIIESGSFLESYCPHCRESLIEGDDLVFTIETNEGRIGKFSLSAFLNVTTHASTVEVPRAEELKDLRCSRCDHTLLVAEPPCGECGSRTAMFHVAAMRKLIGFHICLRMKCNWHGISAEDTQLLALEDSTEW